MFIRICVLVTYPDYEIKYVGGSDRVVNSYEFIITSGIVKKQTSQCHKFAQKYYTENIIIIVCHAYCLTKQHTIV